MKICTITCQNADNYGARLQAYALAAYLNDEGHDVEIIDYRPEYMTFNTRLWYWPGCSVKNWAKLVLQYKQREFAISRHRAFVRFSDRYLPLTEQIYTGIEQLRNNPPQADMYIAGSDQIWNTTFRNGTDAAYYLDFGGDDVRRISYAASFATPTLKKDAEQFVTDSLARLDMISVREQSALNILQSMGYDGWVVVDPVFLLPETHWNKLAGKGEAYSGEYILIYDFMRSQSVKTVAGRLSNLLHCRIISVGSLDLSYADKNFLDASPETFISLIRGARCVVSNSFHGTLFAMIYHRNFFVVEREDGLNIRMTDLLDRYNLQERLITSDVDDSTLCVDVDYSLVEHMMKDDIERCKEFLRAHLKTSLNNTVCISGSLNNV